VIIKLIVEGGSMKPGPAIAQKLGPLGINIGKIISQVNAETSSFKGMKVPAVLDINTKTKEVKVTVLTPSTSELLKREMGAEKGSSKPNLFKIGNIAFERVISITKTKSESFLAKDFKEAVKTVVGSCSSLGLLIDSKDAKEITSDINKGVYDNLIKNKVTEVSAEKSLRLKDFFAEVEKKQAEILKKEEEEKKAKEEAAIAAGTAAPKEGATATAPVPAAAKEAKPKEAAKK